MPFILLSLLFFPLILATAVLLRRRACEAVGAVMLAIAAMGFLLSLFNIAWVGICLVWAAWAASVVFLLWHVVRGKGAALHTPTHKSCTANSGENAPDTAAAPAEAPEQAAPVQTLAVRTKHLCANIRALCEGIGIVDILVLAAAFAFLWYLDRGRYYMIWDEFSHWGMAAKSLFTDGKLVGLVESSDGFAEYPPALAPFFYICMRAVGYGFREDLTLYLQAVFSISLLAYPLRCFSKKHIISPFLALSALFLIPTICYSSYYTSIMVDGLLAVVAAYIIFVAIFGEGDWRDALYATLASLVLSGAIKSTGLVFALMASGIFAVLFYRKTTAEPLAKGTRMTMSLLPIAAALDGKIIWTLFMYIADLERRPSTGDFSVSSVLSFFFGSEETYRDAVFTKFFDNVLYDFNYGSGAIKLSYCLWFAVLTVLFLLLFQLLKRVHAPHATAMWTAFWVSSVFMALYMFSVLGSYLFVFAEGEARALASLSRYLNTPLVIVLLVLTACAVALLAQLPTIAKPVWCVVVAVLWALFVSPSLSAVLEPFADASLSAAKTNNYNRPYAQIAEMLKTYDETGENKLYIVSQYDYGYSMLQINYHLFPEYVPNQYSSITLRKPNNTNYVYYETAEEWAQEISEQFDYIVLHLVDDAFCEDFAAHFEDASEIVNGNFFKVCVADDGTVSFHLLDAIAW